MWLKNIFIINFFPDNTAPSFDDEQITIRVTVGQLFTLQLNASDPDEGDVITYTMTGDAASEATLNSTS